MALCRSCDQTAYKIGVLVGLSTNVEFGAAPEPLPALPDVCQRLRPRRHWSDQSSASRAFAESRSRRPDQARSKGSL